MLARRRPRLPLALLAPSSLVAVMMLLGSAGLEACAKDAGGSSGGTSGAVDTSDGGGDGASGRDGATTSEDAAIAKDAAEGGPTVIDGPGNEGTVCSFNRECHSALRCECTETAGCACKPGIRGTGRNGIDPCADGNACASAVCVEGPPDSGSFCSDECDASTGCTGQLPVCSDIAFVGRICIRTPPK